MAAKGKLKKGALVSVVRERFEGSLEARSSDPDLPPYLFESKGEILDLDEDGQYALVKFYVPTPNIWLNLDHLTLVE